MRIKIWDKFIVCMLICSMSYANDTIKVGFFDLPPHGTVLEGKNVGAALDYFDLLAKKMNLKVEYILEPLPRLLKNQKLDLILYLGKTPERASTLIFSQYPLLKMQGVLVVKSNNPLLFISDISELKNKTIGIWREGYLSPLIIDSRISLERISGDNVIERQLKRVQLGRIQGFYSPEPYSVAYEINKLGLKSELRIINLPELPIDLTPAFTKVGAVKYLKKFESEYDTLRKQKPYIEFLKQYMKNF